MKKTTKLIIFDCDGTLVDSEPITNRVLANFISEFGLQLSPEKSLELFIGRDMPAIVKTLEGMLNRQLPANFSAEFRKRQSAALRSELQPIAGAHELLESLDRPFCLASNAPRSKIQINLEATGLGKFIAESAVFSAYDIQAWKPKPDLFLHAAQAMGHVPSDCIVIEDSVAGVEAARAAGMRVIAFVEPGSSLPLEVDKVNKLLDLIPILNSA